MAPTRKPRRKKIDDSTATMRRFVMMQLIPWEPRSITTPELHRALQSAGYNVEVRTVQRDLVELMSHFQYTSQLQGRTQHWFWPRQCKPLSIRDIGPETALILNLAERHLHDLLPTSAVELLRSYFDQARETLTRQDPKKFGTWKDKMRVVAKGPRFAPALINKHVQAAVFDALLADRQLTARYRGRGQAAAKETVLHPLGVVSRDGVIYLIATAWDYTDPYQYALHRFESAQVTSDASRRPEGFDLDQYVNTDQEFSYPTGEGEIALKVEVDGKAATSLLERRLSPDQTARKLRDGRYRIEATVEDTSDLRWWLMAFGPNLRVVGPRKLQADIRKALTQAAAQYSAATSSGTEK